MYEKVHKELLAIMLADTYKLLVISLKGTFEASWFDRMLRLLPQLL